MTEKDIERKLRNSIQKAIPQAKCLKFVSPGYSGVPDRIILLPGGTVVFAELKRPREKERQRQAFVQVHLRLLGFTVFSSVDTEEKVQEVIDYCWRVYCVRYMPRTTSKGDQQ